MATVQITPVDPADREALLAWNALLRDGFNAGREAAWWASEETTLARFQDPTPERTTVQLVAELDGETVGRALADAVREALAGHTEVIQAEAYSSEGLAFATALGMRLGNQEHRLLLDLPLERDGLHGAGRAVPGLEVRTWHGAFPEDVVEDWTRLTTQMDADVPMGDLTRRAPRSDIAQTRRNEQRMDDQGWTLVRGLAHEHGVAVGYTEIFVNRHDPEILTQDDTLVDRAHRGRGIGRALKLANLENLAAVPEAASARWIQTYTALENAPMLALNRALGFREVEVLSMLEARLG